MTKFIKDYNELDNIKGLTASARKLYNEMRNFLQLSKKNKEYQDENGVPFIFFTEGRAKEIGISTTTYKRAKKQLKDLGLINYSKQPVKKLGIASKIYVEEDLNKVIENLKVLNPVVETKKVEPKKTVKKVVTNNIDNALVETLLNEIREIKKQNEELNNKVEELTKKVEELSNNETSLKPSVDDLANKKTTNIEISTNVVESTTIDSNTNKIQTEFNPIEFNVLDTLMNKEIVTVEENQIEISQEPPVCIVTNDKTMNIETSQEQKESTVNDSDVNRTSTNTVAPTSFFYNKTGFQNDIDRHIEEWKNDPIKIKEFEAKEPTRKRTRKRKVVPKLSFDETMALNAGRPFEFEGKWYSSNGKRYVHSTEVITRRVNIGGK